MLKFENVPIIECLQVIVDQCSHTKWGAQMVIDSVIVFNKENTSAHRHNLLFLPKRDSVIIMDEWIAYASDREGYRQWHDCSVAPPKYAYAVEMDYTCYPEPIGSIYQMEYSAFAEYSRVHAIMPERDPKPDAYLFTQDTWDKLNKITEQARTEFKDPCTVGDFTQYRSSLWQEKIMLEIQRVITELHDIKEPNSPNGKSYHLPLSPNITEHDYNFIRLTMPVRCHMRGSNIYVDAQHKARLDKMLTLPPKVEKRFRNEDGTLDRSSDEVSEKTRAEADWYYKAGKLYFHKGKVRLCNGYEDTGNTRRIKFTCENITSYHSSESMGTWLPDVAGAGNEVIDIEDARLKQFYPPPERHRARDRSGAEPQRDR